MSIRIFSNIGLKFLALGLAAVIWIAVSGERRERRIERTYDIPLAIVGLPSELIITDGLQPSVTARLRGPQSKFRSAAENFSAAVDLAEARAGKVSIIIRPQALDIPEGIELVSITPAKLTLTVEPRRQKIVTIRPFLVGEPARGYSVLDVSVSPDQALVSGPASHLVDMTEVATERVILTGRTENVSITVNTVSDKPLVRVVDPVNTRVTVLLEQTEQPPLTDTTFTAAPAASTSTSDSARIAPSGEAKP